MSLRVHHIYNLNFKSFVLDLPFCIKKLNIFQEFFVVFMTDSYLILSLVSFEIWSKGFNGMVFLCLLALYIENE